MDMGHATPKDTVTVWMDTLPQTVYYKVLEGVRIVGRQASRIPHLLY
jgi:hypothetical protein